ncbi:MAG: ribose-phosphate diphosphokinase [Fibromonadaceae bacterium]|nr:ribose-phosphate diphosphokinase [Fibromonadaceae bacterium]
MSDNIVVTGAFTDDSFAMDVAQFMGVRGDISDTISLKTYANGEFCPRYISDIEDLERVGCYLEGKVVIICSVSLSTRSRNDCAMRNMILARAAKDNGAKKVVLIEPDLFYSAQDRGPYRFEGIEKDREIADLKKFDGQAFTSLLYAKLLKEAGVDTVITVHNHSLNVENLFRDIFEGDFHNLVPAEIYAHYIKSSDFVQTGKNGDNLVIVSPDKGAAPFGNRVTDALALADCKRVILDKKRTGERDVSMSLNPASDVDINYLTGKDVIILDDMVRTGSTIVECCEYLKKNANPRRICFGVTHFYSSHEAREKLNSPFIDEIMTTNTLPDILNRDCQGRLRRKMVVLKLGQWIAYYVLRMFDIEHAHSNKQFYMVDMSSKNPRWPPPSFQK